MNSPWHFGNTTVRNPLRIKDGLTVLSNSALNGNLNGSSQESMFARELDKSGVINLGTQPDFFGRKWRACFSQLGFITHKFSKSNLTKDSDEMIIKVISGNENTKLTGRPYELTPSGERMIKADSVPEQQECMLRTLLAYQIPSPIEPRNGEKPFLPFLFLLQVLYELKKNGETKGISKIEMGIIQTYRDHNDLQSTVKAITDYRKGRDNVIGRVAKKKFDKSTLEKLAVLGGVKSSSIKDYADVNFRYPRLTGLVSYQGRRIVLNMKKEPVIDSIISSPPELISLDDPIKYLIRLWNGATLPTDDKTMTLSEIERFKTLLLSAGVSQNEIPAYLPTMNVAELNQIRIRLEVLYQRILEKEFAQNQTLDSEIEETIAYLQKLAKLPYDTNKYSIEIDDEPAYLEWAVWRSFLAINDLKNPPHEARRFKVDQDFLPVGCAPGGGPDLIFEFDDYALIVEVTLTSSSRQEAAEGEPVRRHIAKEKLKFSQNTGKPVYGLFIARQIDNNTAETFRIGVWYNNDEPDFINIVPITLEQFILLLEKYKNSRYDNRVLRRFFDSCLIPRNAHAPAWKREIANVVDQFIS